MSNTKKRNAQGGGSIRKRSDGRYEARYTVTDESGNTTRHSIYAATKRDCQKKLTETLSGINNHIYQQPQDITTGEWLDLWLDTYCVNLKPATIETYRHRINNDLKPYLGKTKLTALTNIQIQRLYNRLGKGDDTHKPQSPKSIRSIHAILHRALKQAIMIKLLQVNPADNIQLPRKNKPDLHPIMDDDVQAFLNAIRGDPYERLFILDLFSGLRQSELLGLQWDDIDFETGTITVRHQLQKERCKGGGYIFLDDTKNGKTRQVSLAPSVVEVLRQQRAWQNRCRLKAGAGWDNPHNLVFTNELGEHLVHVTVYKHFKRATAKIGMTKTRFHDLRHSYAVNALQAGDSAKIVSEQLGHYSAAFTLDTYAAVSKTMRKESQERMEQLFQSVTGLA